MVDIKTMVSRHCGIELPSVLAANKKRSKLASTLLCWGQVTLKYVFISIKLKKKMVEAYNARLLCIGTVSCPVR